MQPKKYTIHIAVEYHRSERPLPEAAMAAITSLDILNLSHSLKDICEVNCNTPECLSQALKILLQYNLIQANLQFSRQFGPVCPPDACQDMPSVSALNPPAVSGKPPIRLDIADPFLADHEK